MFQEQKDRINKLETYITNKSTVYSDGRQCVPDYPAVV
jgi:hypothetical protein